MSLTGTDYRRYDPRRVCDICGHLWHKSELTRIAPFRWACPDDVKGLTAEDISRHNASVRPLMVKAVKNAKGLSQTPIFQQAEGVVLNAILDKAPATTFLVESGTMGASQDSLTGFPDAVRQTGWMAIYLANLVLENRRPVNWIRSAAAKLVMLADSIVSAQRTTTAAVPASDGMEYGAIFMGSFNGSGTNVFDVPGNGACLIALVKAYQATGAVKYIVAARLVAGFLRRAQNCGQLTSFYAQYSSTTRLPIGPFPESLSISGSTAIPVSVTLFTVQISGLVCAWALALLQSVDGDATYGSTGAAYFVSNPGALLSRAVSDCVSWWQGGAPDLGVGPNIVGLSSTTPRQNFTAGANGGALTVGAWGTTPATDGSMSVLGYEYAMGVRALYEAAGLTEQVSTLYDWLRSFSANPANAAPASTDRTEKSTLGIYDPTLCLARCLQVKNASGAAVAQDATERDIGSLGMAPGYDWRTAGLLAPIQSRLDGAALLSAKNEMSRPRRRRWTLRLVSSAPTNQTVSSAAYDRCDIQDYPVLLTGTGLSMQTSVGMNVTGRTSGIAFGHYIDLMGAAQAADVYRYAPQAFPLEQG